MAKDFKSMGGNLHQLLKNENNLFQAAVIQNSSEEIFDYLSKQKVDINHQNKQVKQKSP
jgi:hypothetical protein